MIIKAHFGKDMKKYNAYHKALLETNWQICLVNSVGWLSYMMQYNNTGFVLTILLTHWPVGDVVLILNV